MPILEISGNSGLTSDVVESKIASAQLSLRDKNAIVVADGNTPGKIEVTVADGDVALIYQLLMGSHGITQVLFQ